MAQNRLSRGGCSSNRIKVARHVKRISRVFLFLSVGLAIVVVGLLVLFIQDDGDRIVKEPVNATNPSRTVYTNIAQVVVEEPVPQLPEETTIDPSARPTKVGEVVNGYVMLPSGRIHKPTGVVTNRVTDYAKSQYSIFEHRSDNEIAAILMMRPGDTVVGTRRYDRWFSRQFLKSCETPIEFLPTDEPWKIDLKRAVIQARKDLKEAYDRGEDIEAIMTESRQQLQDLARYKQSIKQLYVSNMKECETPEQVEALGLAVNKMLEEKGCAPMDFTPLTKQSLLKDKTYE